MRMEVKRPGSGAWESEADLPGGAVPVADAVGTLVRYHTGNAPLVMKVVSLSDPDANGVRQLQMELYTGE